METSDAVPKTKVEKSLVFITFIMHRVVKEATRHYGKKPDSQFHQSGSISLWQELRTITDYRTPSSKTVNADAHLADELNTFYAHFEAAAHSTNGVRSANSTIGRRHAENAKEENAFIISEHDVRKAFGRVKTRKAAGPDGITGRVLKACADQLAPVFTEIFNLSLEQSMIPTCFKQSTIVPVPKKPQPACLNDYRPVALTSVMMKCFERLIKDCSPSSLADTLDSLQFAYHPSRYTEDAIAHLHHTALSHLDSGKGNYVKMLFVDYSSTFNTIIPSILTTKLEILCQWISNFLTDRPQAVWANMSHPHSPSALEPPQGCVLSPLLYSLYTYNCVATSSSTNIIKFADDTAVVGLISNIDETPFLEEIKNLETWHQDNNLLLNVSKTKELLVDFSTKQPLIISWTPVERVDSFR
ncbi:hypothetical protein QTP86_007292 [Hemibagrus guttatus]|nr:hypothetical protein QTP86_007292 [Hemibagrus guttatus]